MYKINYINKNFIKLKLENNFIFFEQSNKYYYTNYFFRIYWFEIFYNNNSDNLKQKSTINIFFNNLLFTNLGIKYLFSKPIHGQRTWSNNKNAKFLNTFLINYKINYFKNYFLGLININNLKQIIFLNYFTWMWKIFWIKDWVFLYKKNKNFLLKNQFSKKKTLTLRKILLSSSNEKNTKNKISINLKNIFDYIGLDELININI